MRALIAVGSNLSSGSDSPADMVRNAMRRVASDDPGARYSRLFRTPAFPPGSGPDFVNAAFAMKWEQPAAALLDRLNAVEAEFGRTRKARWEARIMDLDLIALDQKVLPDAKTQAAWVSLSPDQAAKQAPAELILPHPRLAERSFVLVPLADVAPDWQHPVTGLSVADMLTARPASERAAVVPLDAAS